MWLQVFRPAHAERSIRRLIESLGSEYLPFPDEWVAAETVVGVQLFPEACCLTHCSEEEVSRSKNLPLQPWVSTLLPQGSPRSTFPRHHAYTHLFPIHLSWWRVYDNYNIISTFIYINNLMTSHTCLTWLSHQIRLYLVFRPDSCGNFAMADALLGNLLLSFSHFNVYDILCMPQVPNTLVLHDCTSQVGIRNIHVFFLIHD